MKISVTIITYNEERNIERCLASLKSVADEIIVVDSFSTDQTESICRNFGVKFIKNKFEGHIQQKNFAVKLTKFNYVLALDADEALSNELIDSLLALKASKNIHEAYSFNRLTSYCGKWIKHCGWYPDRKIRLWKKDRGHWGGQNPHDKVIIDSGIKVRNLYGNLLHYSFDSIASHVQTANNFSTIAAKEAVASGKRTNFLIHIILNPIYTFLKKYFYQLGFLDGYYGFVICYLSAVSNFLKYSKIKQIHKYG